MQKRRLVFSVESLKKVNPEMLVPDFIIECAIALMESYRKKPFPFDFRCDQIASPLIGSRSKLPISVDWQKDTFPNSQRLFNTYQREVIVENAAIAVAFILVTHIAECRNLEVTERGIKPITS